MIGDKALVLPLSLIGLFIGSAFWWSCSDGGNHLNILNEMQKSIEVWSEAPYEDIFNRYTDPNPPGCSEATVVNPAPGDSAIRILGFDAVGWRILNVLLKKNQLPNIKRMMCMGSSAIFETDLAESPVSWTTIATGKNRDKHGIRSIRETGFSSFNYSVGSVRTARIWEIFNYHRLSLPIGHYYFTEEGMPRQPDMASQCEAMLAGMEAEGTGNFISFVDMTDYNFHMRLMAFALLETEWFNDVTISPASLPWVQNYSDKTVQALQEMDRAIGIVLKKHPHDTLLIVSDHGARVNKPKVYITLEAQKIFPPGAVTGTESDQTVVLESGITVHVETKPSYLKVAVDKNQDYFLTINTAYITIDTPPDTSGGENAKVTATLSALSFDGLSILHKTHEGFELNPAIIEKVLVDELDSPWIREIFLLGEHGDGDHGIFIAYGPSIRAGFIAEPLQLVDFVPTVLYLTGLPVGGDMDGRVATDIFRTEFTNDNPIKVIDSYDSLIKLPTAPSERAQLTQEEREKYRKVGYPGLD